MSNKTINQALKDLYTGLGGDPQALANNSTCSDYIEDLESAIKGAASGVQIDDTTASETTVFSSAKTEELINGIETLPSVAVGDIGEALIVESDGEGGAQWGKGVIAQDTIVIKGTKSGVGGFDLPSGMTCQDIVNAIDNHKVVILFCEGSYTRTFYFAGRYGNNNIMYSFLGLAQTGAASYQVSELHFNSSSGASGTSLAWVDHALTLS